jgi:hypothetical protein
MRVIGGQNPAILVRCLGFLYMLPAIIACPRNHSHFFAISLIDLMFKPLFLLGWIVALIWAFIDPKRTI